MADHCLKVWAFSTIGPIQVIAEIPAQGWGHAQEIARISIPDENLSDCCESMITRAAQQSFMTPALWDRMKSIVDNWERPEESEHANT